MLLAKDRMSILYCEKGRLEVDGYALVLRSGDQCVPLPVAAANAIFLMPGTVVTHAAVKVCAAEGTLLVWVGDGGTRTYSAGNPGGSCAEKMLHQAALRLDPGKRLAVAKKMWGKMFGSPIQGRSIDQIRGLEGNFVKKMYQELASKHGVKDWRGRETSEGCDATNQAISFANAALYGLSEAVILAMGYSPAIGFIHTGGPRSFVYDVADCLKFSTTVPLGMSVSAERPENLAYRVKVACREMFFREKMTEKIVELVEDILG